MFNIYQNSLQEAFNQSIEEYCQNSAFSSDVHSSINFGQKSLKFNSKKLNPLGTGRPWSKVEKEMVETFNEFRKEFVRQLDLHLKTFNKYLSKETVDQTLQQSNEKKKQYQKFLAKEEILFWQDFPRNKKFYHSYLRKLYTLFNQCKMPESLMQDIDKNQKRAGDDKYQIKNQQKLAAKQKEYIRDIQLILSLCLDLMPQSSQDYAERIEFPQPLSSIIHNVWELTDYYTQTVVLSNESKGDSRETNEEVKSVTDLSQDKKDNQQQNINNNSAGSQKAYGETILSGGVIMSFIGGLGGLEVLKASGIDMNMDKEARHLRKYLYQNRIKFDHIVEMLNMFDADNLKNWAFVGNSITIMVSDVIQIFLSTQENLKISMGLVEVLMTYSSFFSKSFCTIEQDIDTKTIFDMHQNQIQYQWAQIFGQISKLSPITFDNCLNFITTALNNDHKMKKVTEIEDLAEQIFHSRFLHIQPFIVDQNLFNLSQSYKLQVQQQQQSQTKKASKVVSLFNEMLNYLTSQNVNQNFKIVLLKTLRHLIAQLNFRDSLILSQSKELRLIWQNAIQNVFQYVDNSIISNIFPGVSSINLKKKVNANHWDDLLESHFNQHILLLIIQIIKVSEESFYNEALLRLMNWICLPQMLENRKTFDLATRVLMELSTPELYKLQEFMFWQPRILNHIYFLQDTDKNACTPIVSHTDLQVFNQMPHRSPAFLNHNILNQYQDAPQSNQIKYGVSFKDTYPIIFDKKIMDLSLQQKLPSQNKESVKFFHYQYLDLMAIYDLQYLCEKVIPDFILCIESDSLFSQEMLLLALTQSAKILDPSLNFRQKYLTIHSQIAEKYQDQQYFIQSIKLLDEVQDGLKNLIENALTLIIQSPIFNGKFVQDTFDFLKSSQYKELCIDYMGVIWPSPSLSLMKESQYVSKFLKKHGFAEYLADINHSYLTFEDNVEIMGHHYDRKEEFDPYAEALAAQKRYQIENGEDQFNENLFQEDDNQRYNDFFVIPNEQYDHSKDQERGKYPGADKKIPEYISNDLNKITANIETEIGLQWDKKKENYMRHRLLMFLLEDRSKSQQKAQNQKQNENTKKKVDQQIPKDSWLNDSSPIQVKQKSLIYGQNCCQKRKSQLKIRNKIIKMIHYLPNVLKSKYLCQSICEDLLLNEKEEILELTDQTSSIAEKLNLLEDEYVADSSKVFPNNLSVIDQLTIKLHNVTLQYKKEFYGKVNSDNQTDQIIGGGAKESQLLGGTLRLNKQKSKDYDRLKNVSQCLLAYGLLSTDYELSSKTSKLLQKMMIFGDLKQKVQAVDQIIYIIKELMIEKYEEYHLQMYLQLLVSCIKLWHHYEIHRLRLNEGNLLEQLKGIQFFSIGIDQPQRKKINYEKDLQTNPDIQNHLYIFDIIDSISLIGICNKEKIVRNLSLSLIQESGKLKRLIASHDTRKCLADLLYYNDFSIKDKIVERMTLIKMFKFRNQNNPSDTFTKTYNRDDINEIIQNLSFHKIIEDNFDYKQSKVNESLARDIAVQYIGELATLWKNNFKNLMTTKKQNLKDSQISKLKKQHRVIGQKLINFVYNISRRSIIIFEQKMDSVQKREEGIGASESNQNKYSLKLASGPPCKQANRKPVQHASFLSAEKDYVGLNIIYAIVLYNISISSFNQLEPFSDEIYIDGELNDLEEEDQETFEKEKGNKSNPNDCLDFNQVQRIEEAKVSQNLIKKNAPAGSQPKNSKTYKIQDIQDDLFNIIQLVKLDLCDFQKSPPGNFAPQKIPISSIILAFQYLIQSPLPLALSNKRANLTFEKALLNRRRKLLSGKSRPSSKHGQRQEPQQSDFNQVCTKIDIVDLLLAQFKTINHIFNNQLKENIDKQYILNSIFFFCTLFVGTDSCDGETLQNEVNYLIKKQNTQQNLEMCNTIIALIDVSQSILENQKQQQALDVIKSVLYNGLTKIVRILIDLDQQQQQTIEIEIFAQMIPLNRQIEIVNYCQKNSLTSSDDWLIHKNKQSYQIILHYQWQLNPQGGQTYLNNQIQLDLQYLINMQALGYNVLKHFRLDQNGYAQKVQLSVKDQMTLGVKEIKLLIGSIYEFYSAQENINQLLQNVNPFYECFLNQVIQSGVEEEKQKILKFLQENRFAQAYEKLIKTCFNIKYQEEAKQKRVLIDIQLKKFIQYNIHTKIFLLALTMALNLRHNGNPEQISQIERSKIICLVTLPLMFDSEEYREQVEQKISNMPDLSQLVLHDNKDFFRLIKMMIKDEDIYNLQNHFEKYFAINGFIRNLLNEIIKFQSQNDSKIYSPNSMLIRILDTLTYFLSDKGGSGIQLRRAPKNIQDHSSFLFDNLIDYKSFEFLSKLFKITEKLIEFDSNMMIMNMWYKIVENQRANYEILAKFLIHNLSSQITKLKQNAQNQSIKMGSSPQKISQASLVVQDEAQYCIEFEKTKRYSINIFNYIKARVQRADIRNSIQVSAESPVWSKKMIELLQQSQLNVQSKYVLEKVKLKKILQTMHREINQTGVALKLKGGIDTEILVMQFQNNKQESKLLADGNFDQMINQSVRMSQLLESQTFLNTFSCNRRKEQSIVQNLLFNFQRIMKEKFVKITPANQLNQFNHLIIKYFENSLVFIANDTDRQLQYIKFTKEQELIVVVVMLILIGHLIMNYTEKRFKYLLEIFKTLQSNISGLQPFFYLNTLSPRQLQLNQGKTGNPNLKEKQIKQQNQFSQRIFTMFNYKTTLFDCFDQFTTVFFTVTNNIPSDTDLRINLMELYQNIFKGLRELQKLKLNNKEEGDEDEDPSFGGKKSQTIELQNIPQTLSMIQSGRKLRETILSIMKSAFFNLHEIASIQNRITSVNSSQQSNSHFSQYSLQGLSPSQIESKLIFNLSKNFRQHVSNMMDYILYAYELDKLKRDLQVKQQQTDIKQLPMQNRKAQASVISNNNDILAMDMSSSTRQILFALNTLFWVGIACSEAPNHIKSKHDQQLQNNAYQFDNFLLQIQQIQYIGMAAIRRILEDTNFLKILYVFQNLSDIFYSYNLPMSQGKTSFINIILNSIKNPLCTRDALKMLILTIKVQDSRLILGKSQLNIDEESNQDQDIGKFELIRLLYLLPYFMQQFIKQTGLVIQADDQIFQNKKNMIQLLKKSLPSIGINKKSEIFQRLEEIQRKTANDELKTERTDRDADEYLELENEFEKLIKFTADLIYQQGLNASLIDCLKTFKILHKYQIQRFKQSQEKQNNDQPIKYKILEMIIEYLQKFFKEEDIDKISAQTDEKILNDSIFNKCTEILGEETDNYRNEFKALYFGIKNVIIKEIEQLDQESEINQFFDKEACARIDSTLLENSSSLTLSSPCLGHDGNQPVKLSGEQASTTPQRLGSFKAQNQNSSATSGPVKTPASAPNMGADKRREANSSKYSAKNAHVALISNIDLNSVPSEQLNNQTFQQPKRQLAIPNQVIKQISDQFTQDYEESKTYNRQEYQQNQIAIDTLDQKKYTHSPNQERDQADYSNLKSPHSQEDYNKMKINIRQQAQYRDQSLQVLASSGHPQDERSGSRSKSRTRYTADQEDVDQDFDLDERIPIKGAAQLTQPRSTVQQKSFADLTLEQHEIMESHKKSNSQPSQGVSNLNINKNLFNTGAPGQKEEYDADIMTFQKHQPKRLQTVKTEMKEQIQFDLPDSQMMNEGTSGLMMTQKQKSQVYQGQGDALYDNTDTNNIQFHDYASIDPNDNISQQSLTPQDNRAQQAPNTNPSLDPPCPASQQSRWLRANLAPEFLSIYKKMIHQQNEQIQQQNIQRTQTQQDRPKTQQNFATVGQVQRRVDNYHTTQTQGSNKTIQHYTQHSQASQKRQFHQQPPSALVPNFVAEKSNQIWSDVASQKSQSLASQSMKSSFQDDEQQQNSKPIQVRHFNFQADK